MRHTEAQSSRTTLTAVLLALSAACTQAGADAGNASSAESYLLVLDGSAAEPAGLAVERRYRHLPVLHVRARGPAAWQSLASLPGVRRVEKAVAYTPSLAQSLPLIGQPAVAALGMRGAGTTVVVADGPVDSSNPAFGKCAAGELSAPGCKLVANERIAAGTSTLTNGHGNNVAAIVLGVAPEARVAALDIFSGGTAFTPDLLAAIDWAIEHKDQLNIAAINLSLGAGAHDRPCADDSLSIAIAWARAAGIATTVAAGNDGHADALSAPACAPSAVSVGAVYKSALGGIDFAGCLDQSTAADQVPCFSNAAPFLTLLAPGAVIAAGGLNMAGTSQAAPHVAGAFAVLRAAFPAESVDELLARLRSSPAIITDKRNGLRVPRLDLPSAVAASPAEAPLARMSINSGAAITTGAAVTLSLAPTGAPPAAMCLTNGAVCIDWVPFVPSLNWTLLEGKGPRTVRAWLRDAQGATPARYLTASVLVE